MRIIAGEFRGRRLHSFEGKHTRPTSDRLRETIFNILSDHSRQSVVLDLFSGTGAMAIEALSRGAISAVLVDNCHRTSALIERNIRLLSLESKTRILRWNIMANLNPLKSLDMKFNLVFMDPPYDRNMIDPALNHLIKSGSLAQDVRIVVEHAVQESVNFQIPEIELTDQRVYGRTMVSFLSFNFIDRVN
jgi:16S rRNA (guanine966-N2)-methyltransferase